jgi:energy-coupling factor transporter ATP-binding protein EcfA2
MAAALLASCGVLALAATGLGLIELDQYRRRQWSWQSVRLHFGRDLTPEAVSAVLDAMAGLPPNVSLVLDLSADHAGISHYLHSDRVTLETLRGSFRAVLPNLRLEPVETPPLPAGAGLRARSIRLCGGLRVLRQDNVAETSAGLLAAMQPLRKGERLLLRWLIRSGRPAMVLREQPGQAAPSERSRLLRAKNDGGVLRARGLVAASAKRPQRAWQLLSRVGVVLRTRTTAYGYLRLPSHYLPSYGLRRRYFLFGDRYGSQELGGLLGWPIEAPALPGLSLGTSPLLMPSPRLPRSGRLLGTATWPGAERPIAQPLLGALSHTLIAGPTGVGKSTLLTSLIAADIAAGRGTVLIDGKGDTADAVLARIPASRQSDVIVLDCASSGAQPGLQLFGSGDSELAADVVLGVFSDLFRDAWGPLSERYLRAGLLAVAHDPGGTLADVPYVYSDPAYRRQLVGQIRDPLTRATFAAFEGMSSAERQHQLAAPLNKLGSLLGRPIVRTVLGQAAPQLNFREVLAKRRIVVISLAPARVGAPAARLIGALSVFALFQAVLARASLSQRARSPFLVYIDEPKALGDLPMPLDALLEQARGLGVGVTLAPQSMAQLPKALREAALTNIASRVIFRQHADDARLLARDLPGVSAESLGDLAAYEAIARVGLGPGDVAPPVSLKTADLDRPLDSSRRLRAAAAKHWGQPQAEVDAALSARHEQVKPSMGAPVGRRRRVS